MLPEITEFVLLVTIYTKQMQVEQLVGFLDLVRQPVLLFTVCRGDVFQGSYHAALGFLQVL